MATRDMASRLAMLLIPIGGLAALAIRQAPSK